MLTHNILNKNYYSAQELVKSDPIFFKRCLKRVREIINVFDIPKVSYIFCNKQNGDIWTPITGKFPASKDKLFISQNWCSNHVPQLCKISNDELFPDDDYYHYINVRGERMPKECYFPRRKRSCKIL